MKYSDAIPMLTQFLQTAKKPVVFMIVGGLGCFAAALLAEIFLYLTSKGSPPQMVCLTLDVSGSMAGSKMDEIKVAAKKFIDFRKLSRDQVALTIFSSESKVLVPFTQNKNELIMRIDDLISFGGTNFEAAMKESESVITSLPSNASKSILLFTDGASSEGDPAKAIATAEALRKNGIRIFSIVTEDADFAYLAGLVGSEKQVIRTSDGGFEKAFAEAEKMISASQLMQSDGGYYTNSEAFLRTSIWTIFLALGISFALVAIQNHYLRRPLLPLEQLVIIGIGSIAVGFIAGFVGQSAQSVFVLVSEKLKDIGRILGWIVLGTLLARGMVFFIPNLNAKKALSFGAAGGFLGVIGYGIMVFLTGDTGGRLIGAFILGACIGLLIAIVESLYRNVWLMVMYNPRDFTQVNLGSQKVTVGSGKGDTVLVPDAPEKAGEFSVQGNAIQYTDATGTRTLVPGSSIHIGGVELVVCSNDVAFAPSKFYPMKMSKVREM